MSNLQNFVQHHSRLTIDDRNKNNQKLIEIQKETTKIDENGNIEKHKKRIFDNKQKKEIFDNAKEYKQFDTDTMKVDLTGFIVIKDIVVIDTQRKDVSCEYEHIHSHNQGGQTEIENAGLLQSKLNRSKGDTPLYGINYNELKELKKKCGGIKPKYLLHGLENDYDNTCKKINLFFEKVGKKWQPIVLAKTLTGKNIYKPYYKDETDFYYKTYISEDAKHKLDNENYNKLNEFYKFDEIEETTLNSIPENKVISENENKKKGILDKISAITASLSYLHIIGGIIIIGGICYGSYRIYKYYQDKQKQKEIYEKYQENISEEKNEVIKLIEENSLHEEQHEEQYEEQFINENYKNIINYLKKTMCNLPLVYNNKTIYSTSDFLYSLTNEEQKYLIDDFIEYEKQK